MLLFITGQQSSQMLLFGKSIDTHTPSSKLVFILCSACIVKSRCTLDYCEYVLIIIIMVPTKKNLLNNNLVTTMLYVAIFIGSLGFVQTLTTFCYQKIVILYMQLKIIINLNRLLLAIIIFLKASWCGFVSDTVSILRLHILRWNSVLKEATSRG